MNEWKALYFKEMKEYRAVFVFLLGLTTLTGLAAANSTAEPFPSLYMLWVLPPYAVVFILPFLLTHSIAQEIKGQTQYLLLSLPVSRGAIFLCKVGALATAAVAIYLLATAAIQLIYSHILDQMTADDSRIAVRDLWFLIGEGYFSLLFMTLGIASSIAGLRLVVWRFQGLMAVLVFGCAVYVYLRLLEPGRQLLRALDIDYQFPIFTESGELYMRSAHLDLAVYSALFGLALIFLGAWVFARRAEV